MFMNQIVCRKVADSGNRQGKLRYSGFIAALFVGLLCTEADAGTITFEGSSTVGKFMNDAREVYKNSTIQIDTRTESFGGELCILNASCHMGGVARAIRWRFVNRYIQLGIAKMESKEAISTLIGRDAIAVVVNASNPIKALTSQQLKDIFTGEIKNWNEVGGENRFIKTFIVDKSSATRGVFQKTIMGKKEYQKSAEVIRPDSAIVTSVAHDIGSIGQISFAFIQGRNDIRALEIDHQQASVSNPNYPITRPLNILTQGMPTGEVKAFLDWTLSPAGQAVVKRKFVGVK